MIEAYIFTPRLSIPYFQEEKLTFRMKKEAEATPAEVCTQALRLWKIKHPDRRILEISPFSFEEAGRELCPDRLMLRVENLRKSFPVSLVFLASQAYSGSGPFYDLLGMDLAAAKKDERLTEAGVRTGFQFEGLHVLESDAAVFHTWLYLKALQQHPELSKTVLFTHAFLDLKSDDSGFLPARACAVYCAMEEMKQLFKLNSYTDFLAFWKSAHLDADWSNGRAVESLETLRKPAPKNTISFRPGQWIMHPTLGRGEVLRRTSTSYLVRFPISGTREIDASFARSKCTPIDAPATVPTSSFK